MKALYFDRSGSCIWAKRLERGVFMRRHSGELKHSVSYTDLKLSLEGIDVNDVRSRRRFSLDAAPRALQRLRNKTLDRKTPDTAYFINLPFAAAA
jgi:hypothetical protein